MLPKNRLPSHPGEILLREFLEPMGITQVELAKAIGVPVQRINTIINGKRGITAETALLLAKRFKTSPHVWLNLQNRWDVYQVARRRLGKQFRRESSAVRRETKAASRIFEATMSDGL